MEYSSYLLDEELYVVHNVKEIVQILTELANHKVMLKAAFNKGNDVYFTTVIAVDARSKSVYLDIGRDDAFNVRLLASDHVIFSKDDGIKIKWVSDKVSDVNLKDGRAIKIDLPHEMVRLQRREYFRLTTPRVNPVPCQIPIPAEEDPDHERILELALVDVSLGGIGVVSSDPLDIALAEGASFGRCKVSLPDIGVTSLNLKVKYIVPMHMRDGAVKHRIGFQYIDSSRVDHGLVQRYTFHLERLAIALASGISK